jgi:branched-chain amino acid transport system permease protein
MKKFFSDLYAAINKEPWSYVVTLGLMIVGSVLVYATPRSLGAFLLLMLSPLAIYFLKMNNKIRLFIGLVLAIIILPVLGIRNIFYLEVLFQICVFAALALGLNIVIGMAGLLDLGYVAFYAVGAYTWAFFGSKQISLLYSVPGAAPANAPFFLQNPNWFWLFIFLGIGLAAFAGILLGLPVLRLRGDYLAIVTLGFGEVIRVLALNLDKPLNITNGPQGITPIQRPTLSPLIIEPLRKILQPIVGHEVTDAQFYNVLFYFLALAVIIIAIIVARRLEDSRIGRAWTAIREDETAAIAMGIPLVKMKLAAFASGAAFAGAMGVIYAANRTFVSPETFSFLQSIGVLSMVILGGLGSIPGVIIGAAVVVFLNIQVLQSFSLYLSSLRQSDAVIPIINFAWKNLSTQLDPAKYQKLVFGVILVVMMIFRPAGLIPAERRKRELAVEAEDSE